ncbi:MAG TPA: glucose 1-dehydrogenase [Candidatus Marinimicrobia bacterium]|jgi:3-oxoacyl-[acyl-carrier protein] reductase|nr:glucose 1-dehydrogenase [Candidatus Neomarinimicrobiota bacterium]HQQ85527.1 glucose 1-dehydrogenase [Candidatus Neomarinimicrobiota bacterium]
MNINLTRKTAIITGSVQGIGFDIAKIFTECGASVVINNNLDADSLEIKAEELRKSGADVKAVVADVTIKEEAQKLIDAALSFGDTIDILVNNAGGLIKRVPIAEFDENHFWTVVNVNLKSAFIMSHLVMPYMKEQRSGKIVNLSSQAAHDGGGSGAAVYAASKGGIWTFTKSLAKEVASFGICVNCIAPGFIENTAFHNTFSSKETHEKVLATVPLGRLGTVRDISRVALFLASELSDYMTGQSLQVNGGLYMP